ncbi:Hypp7047 [Branchiostoma lanceolatum]|uniref:Hypp7047 protein n=1 Tax=Branchiostoma lanceolatum TaxID=7740 RepID=A0A8J9YWS7_BRALA|nr:Hypp7047 [Branchiostoma lanceolatum]
MATEASTEASTETSTTLPERTVFTENNCRPIYSSDNNFGHDKAAKFSDGHGSNDGDVYRDINHIARNYSIDGCRGYHCTQIYSTHHNLAHNTQNNNWLYHVTQQYVFGSNNITNHRPIKGNDSSRIYSGDHNFGHNKPTNYSDGQRSNDGEVYRDADYIPGSLDNPTKFSDDHRSNDGDVYGNTDHISRKYHIDHSNNKNEHYG